MTSLLHPARQHQLITATQKQLQTKTQRARRGILSATSMCASPLRFTTIPTSTIKGTHQSNYKGPCNNMPFPPVPVKFLTSSLIEPMYLRNFSLSIRAGASLKEKRKMPEPTKPPHNPHPPGLHQSPQPTPESKYNPHMLGVRISAFTRRTIPNHSLNSCQYCPDI